VHREQAGECGYFFTAEAAGQLASLMAQHEDVPHSSRRDREQEAIAASQHRTRQFAVDFAETLERASALYRHASPVGLNDRA
jgi:hypothetical protein